jgi:acetyl esterase/lipase
VVPGHDEDGDSPLKKHGLEPAAEEFARAAAEPPAIYELAPQAARQVLEDIQGGSITKPDVVSTWANVPTTGGQVPVRIVRPVGSLGPLPAVLYLHGGGWVLGSSATHDRLVRELAVGADAAIVFVDYDRAPEARYPVALEQAYAVARWVHQQGDAVGLDPARLAVAGDSSGGNLAAALAILATQRGEVRFAHQSLYYPATDAAQDTDSYREFADGPHLTAAAMAWFWDSYVPDVAVRGEPTASPLRASLEELAGLPESLIIVGECDVLRDEGEAYARRLTAAGVRCTSVRYNGTLHDFMMLNALRETAAAATAIGQAAQVLREALHPGGMPEEERMG